MSEKSQLPDYRQPLRGELERRRTQNPNYSLRAFARFLEISPGYLSDILSGTKNLSPGKATLLARKLGFSPAHSEEWLRLVQLHLAFRAMSGDRTQNSPNAPKLIRRLEVTTLQLDAFAVISDWYHYAIRELTGTRGFKNCVTFVANRLGISKDEARSGLDRLLRLGLLHKHGSTVKKAAGFIATPSDQYSAALRSFHSQMIEKAKQACTEQETDERDITGVTVPMDPSKLPELKNEIRKFRRRIAKLCSDDKATEVYQLNIQLFRLTQKEKN